MASTNSKNFLSPASIISVVVLLIIAIAYFYKTSDDLDIKDNDSQKVVEQSDKNDNSRPESTSTKSESDNKITAGIDSSETVDMNTAPKVVDVEPVMKFVEGVDYITKFPDELSKTPVLIEFFSYMCPHCFNFEPTLKRWYRQKPASVTLFKVPVTFGRESWRIAARAYYIAEELDLVDEFSQAMFKKIHIEKKPPQNDADLGKLFAELGVKMKTYNNAAHSFNVDSKLRKAEFLVKKYKVSGVPYFLINEKYEAGTKSYESERALFRLWNQLPLKDF